MSQANSSPLRAKLASLGFDPVVLRYALRTAVAAVIALVVSWLLGMDHPQWSAMTVWAASQPTRGQLLEKGFFRSLGTLVGVIAGIGLVIVSNGDLLWLVIGLSLWVGLCSAAGNIVQGYVSYGAVVAGFSASMVSLLDNGHPGHVLTLGADRFFTILIGVLTALVVGWLLTPSAEETVLANRLRRLTAEVLREIGQSLRQNSNRATAGLAARMKELTQIEESLEPHGAGSIRSRRFVRSVHTVLISELAALLWLHNGPSREWPDEVADKVSEAATLLEKADDIQSAAVRLQEAGAMCGRQSQLGPILEDLAQALFSYRALDETEEGAPAVRKVLLHRDYLGGWQAFVRTTASSLLVGGFWVATGVTSGPYMLLGVTLMMAMFSTFENPVAMLPFVALGQAAGAAAMILCQWGIWPSLTSEAQMVAAMVPFVLFGAFVMGYRKTVRIHFDYNMVFLLLTNPLTPMSGPVWNGVSMGFAVVIAPVFALVVFQVLYPVNARARAERLIKALIAEVKAIAADPNADQKRLLWRSRFYHRVLRLVRWHGRAGGDIELVANGGLATMNVGRALFAYHASERDETLPKEVLETAREAVSRIQKMEEDPVAVAQAFEVLSRKVAPVLPDLARKLDLAATDIADNAAFFSPAPQGPVAFPWVRR